MIASFGRRQKRPSSQSAGPGGDNNNDIATTTPTAAAAAAAASTTHAQTTTTSLSRGDAAPNGDEEPPSPFASPAFKWKKTPRLMESELEEMDDKGRYYTILYYYTIMIVCIYRKTASAVSNRMLDTSVYARKIVNASRVPRFPPLVFSFFRISVLFRK